jgi:hypothetical protein
MHALLLYRRIKNQFRLPILMLNRRKVLDGYAPISLLLTHPISKDAIVSSICNCH